MCHTTLGSPGPGLFQTMVLQYPALNWFACIIYRTWWHWWGLCSDHLAYPCSPKGLFTNLQSPNQERAISIRYTDFMSHRRHVGLIYLSVFSYSECPWTVGIQALHSPLPPSLRDISVPFTSTTICYRWPLQYSKTSRTPNCVLSCWFTLGGLLNRPFHSAHQTLSNIQQ